MVPPSAWVSSTVLSMWKLRPTAKSPLGKGTWTHLAFVVHRTKRTITVYVDGNPERTTKLPDAFTAALDVKGRDLHIPSTYKPFKGRFADLRVYRRPLTEAQVKAICNRSKGQR